MARTSIAVQITGDVRDLQRAFGQAETGAAKLQRNLSNVGSKLTLGVTLPLLAAGGAAVKLFNDQAQAEAKLASAFKSMGAEAWTSIDALQNTASALQDVTTYGDEATIAMQSVLLSFGNIQNQVGGDNNIFDRTTAAVLDMAAALDLDLKSAAIQVGKALNDPAVGMSMLSRAGVTFSQEQQRVIKDLAATGDLLGAQKLMLQELERQFGGTAEQIAGTDAGKMKQAFNEIGDAAEKLGAVLAPIVVEVADAISGLAQKFGDLDQGTQSAIIKLGFLAAATGPLMKVGALAVAASVGVRKLWNSLAILSMIGGGGLTGAVSGLGLVAGGLGAIALPASLAVAAIGAVGFAIKTHLSFAAESAANIDSFADAIRNLDQAARDSLLFSVFSNDVEQTLSGVSGWGIPFEDTAAALQSLGLSQAEVVRIIKGGKPALSDWLTSMRVGANLTHDQRKALEAIDVPLGNAVVQYERAWKASAQYAATLGEVHDSWQSSWKEITDSTSIARMDGWIASTIRINGAWGLMSDTARDEARSQAAIYNDWQSNIDGFLANVVGLFEEAPDQIAVAFDKWEQELAATLAATDRWVTSVKGLVAAGFDDLAAEIQAQGPAAADAAEAYLLDPLKAAAAEGMLEAIKVFEEFGDEAFKTLEAGLVPFGDHLTGLGADIYDLIAAGFTAGQLGRPLQIGGIQVTSGPGTVGYFGREGILGGTTPVTINVSESYQDPAAARRFVRDVSRELTRLDQETMR